MSVSPSTPYDRMPDFVESVFNVFQLTNRKAEKQSDKRLKMIALTIYNYVRKLAKDNSVDLSVFEEPRSINLIPIFEYISHNNIELFDFSNIDIADVDITKAADLERFVLTHIYYITQAGA